MAMDRDELQAMIDTVLAIPLHRMLGMRLIDAARPSAGIAIEVGDLARNNTGILHGGLVPLFMDVSCYLAVIGLLESGTHAVTVNTASSLMLPVPAGGTVHFSGRVTRRGRSLVFLSAEATHGDRVVATGQIVKSITALQSA